MIPFNTPHIHRPLRPKIALGKTSKESEPADINVKKLIIEAAISVVASFLLKKYITAIFSKK